MYFEYVNWLERRKEVSTLAWAVGAEKDVGHLKLPERDQEARQKQAAAARSKIKELVTAYGCELKSIVRGNFCVWTRVTRDQRFFPTFYNQWQKARCRARRWKRTWTRLRLNLTLWLSAFWAPPPKWRN